MLKALALPGKVGTDVSFRMGLPFSKPSTFIGDVR